MEIKKGMILDVIDLKTPALNATSDMPVRETTPDVQVTPAAPAEEVKSEASKTTEESATPATESPGEPPKPARGVQKKLDRLTKEAEDERREKEKLAEELAGLKKRLEIIPQAEPAGDAPQRPLRTQFNTPDEYDSAVDKYIEEKSKYEARTTILEQQAKEQEARVNYEHNMIRESYQKRLEQARVKHPDFKDKAESPDLFISMPLADAIIKWEQGTELQYYLATHPEEAKRISEMTTVAFDPMKKQMVVVPDASRQLYEATSILYKMNQEPKPQISSAPTPVKPIVPSTEGTDIPDEEMTPEQYASKHKNRLKLARAH